MSGDRINPITPDSMVPEEFKAIAPTPTRVMDNIMPNTPTMFNVLFIV
jgi:hypothetical protein